MKLCRYYAWLRRGLRDKMDRRTLPEHAVRPPPGTELVWVSTWRSENTQNCQCHKTRPKSTTFCVTSMARNDIKSERWPFFNTIVLFCRINPAPRGRYARCYTPLPPHTHLKQPQLIVPYTQRTSARVSVLSHAASQGCVASGRTQVKSERE